MKKIKLFLLGCIVIMTSASVFAQNGLHFDRVNDFVQTTYGGVLGAANRTFEAWIYVDASAPAANLCILDYGTNAAGDRNTFVVTGTRGINFTSGGTNANLSSSSTGLIIDNTWTHVAFVLNSGTGFLYVNGVQVGTGNLSGVSTPSGANLTIGQRVAGGSILFGGIIDEVRVWSVARTPAEILATMNRELCGTPANLAAYYKLNEGVAGGANAAVTTTVDEVAAANGTLNGFALTGATSNWLTGNTLSPGAVVNNQTLNECSGFSVTIGGNTYNTTGNYSDTLPGASFQGCDSIINTNLNITTVIDATNDQTLNECFGFSVTIGGNTYNTTGNYSDTLVGASFAGCDSIINTDLTVSSAIMTNQTLNECLGFSITIGNNTYDTTGIYSDTLVGASFAGCDSIVNTDLTVAVIDTTIANSTSSTLTANQPGAIYQWLDCDNNFAVISGATSQAYTAPVNGNYAVEITLGTCIDTSVCMLLTAVGINELVQKTVTIYPNPASNNIQVNLGTQVAILNYSLTSITGEVIKENTVENIDAISIDISKEAKGVYFLKLNNTTYKVIKE